MNKKSRIFGNGIKATLLTISTLSIICATPLSIAADPQFIIVGTGGVTGVYYPAGGAICRTVNKERKETGVRCSVERTQGSVANLSKLGSDELDLVVAQSDSQYHAYHGTNVFESSGANKNLRSVFSLYTEPFTVVARKQSGIKNFDDLAGKRVNIGNPGSGHRETMNILMRAKGWTIGSFAIASELSSAEQARALCNDEIDAFVFSVGYPSGSLKDAANSCDVVLVAINEPIVDKLIAENSVYTKTVIPGGMYRGTESDVTTLGVRASLITSTKVNSELIYTVVKNVIENLDTVKSVHPAFKNLDAKLMAANSSNIPTHKGAEKYFKEAGLLR